jgi:hypothetical protein
MAESLVNSVRPASVEMPNGSQVQDTLWNDVIITNASNNCPSVWSVIKASRFTPAVAAALVVLFLLWWIQPAFVQAEQTGDFTLPTLSYRTMFSISLGTFILVFGTSFFTS